VFYTDGALMTIIRQYTREAGVRNLEREIASICRKVAKKIVEGTGKSRIRISSKSVQRYLSVPKFRHGETEGRDEIGLATGLAWTEVGGELLAIEVSIMPGAGKLILTGKLGDVMQESAQAALTYVRARAATFGLSETFYKKMDIHVHVPEGAIPKDGPSAGITMATAIASAFMRRKVRGDLAMTGEITLRGRVLSIGGLKEKLLAAHRGGIRKVMIPKDNEKDLTEVPANVLKDLEIIMVDHVDEVLKVALLAGEGQPEEKKFAEETAFARPEEDVLEKAPAPLQ
jgi:ATP-dependent Lon protease